VDPNKERREAVKRKITQYLKRAEEIFNCHLQRSLGSGSRADTGYSSLRFRPIRTLSSAVENLRRCKVVGVIDKVQIVQDPATGGTFILKSLPKSLVEARERQTIIPHGVPFMVKLLCYYASEDSIFLHLEHVQGKCFCAGCGLCLNRQCSQRGNLECLLPSASSHFPGEMLWSHLRSKYCVQQGSSDGSGSLQSTHIPSLRDCGREEAEGSFRGSNRDCVCSARTSRGPLGPAKRRRPCGSGPGVQEPARGASVAGGPRSEGPGSGQGRSLAPCGCNQRAWAVKEEQVQLWAAEILLALEGLHQQGVLCRDLNPRNVLLDTAGHVRLTFFGQWAEVEPQCSSRALEELYGAPEVGGIAELTEAADCWSFGSLLYELLTGVPLSQNHPSGIQPHTQLYLPDGLSLAAVSLLTELLQHSPRQRLGSGGGGIAKLKSHSFFSTIQWNKLGG
ncbi:RPKL1 protein, partial [Nothocercus nigrocapillus]|nr:RPKL1 protein [Nothocercus nigrocapillus]